MTQQAAAVQSLPPLQEPTAAVKSPSMRRGREEGAGANVRAKSGTSRRAGSGTSVRSAASPRPARSSSKRSAQPVAAERTEAVTGEQRPIFSREGTNVFASYEERPEPDLSVVRRKADLVRRQSQNKSRLQPSKPTAPRPKAQVRPGGVLFTDISSRVQRSGEPGQ